VLVRRIAAKKERHELHCSRCDPITVALRAGTTGRRHDDTTAPSAQNIRSTEITKPTKASGLDINGSHSCNRASAVAASGRNPSKRLTKLFFVSLVSLVLVVKAPKAPVASCRRIVVSFRPQAGLRRRRRDKGMTLGI